MLSLRLWDLEKGTWFPSLLCTRGVGLDFLFTFSHREGSLLLYGSHC